MENSLNYLVDHKFSKTTVDRTPKQAIITLELELVKFLIPLLGEKKFAVDNFGDTCLTLAIKQQKEDVVEYLLQEGGFSRQH